MKISTKDPKTLTQWQELTARLAEINDLKAASDLLNWDQTTYMPPGGAAARGRQLATLQRLAHEKFTDPAIGKLLDNLERYTNTLPYADDAAALIRVTQREYAKAVRVPASFTARLAHHTANSYDLWTQARPANDFAAVAPILQETLTLSRQMADFFPGYQHIADPLIDLSDYGMTVQTLRPLFHQLKEELLVLVRALARQEQVEDSMLHHFYPEAQQWGFGVEVIKSFGYDFRRGRQDKTVHPYMTKFSLGDVRITTRVQEDYLAEYMFSTMHEAGHALYEQGIDAAYEATPLAEGTSSGVHESQSRLWENQVGRSLPFWRHYYPRLQALFPAQLGHVTLPAFYRAINKVSPSLIRTDADEVTYNLHVIIRFELELALLEGTLAVADLPEAWNRAYAEYLGVTPTTHQDGVLQDVHWYAGFIGGMFQGYTLGNLLAAQYFAAAQAHEPAISDEIAQGEFGTLHQWLQENIYRHGAKFTTSELTERVTGEQLRVDPYLVYLREKYGEIYGLPA
ncbi:MAG: carboxypeptidase M32 [Caldilineaceae bacterium]